MAGGDDYRGLQQPSGGYGAAAGGGGAGYSNSQAPRPPAAGSSFVPAEWNTENAKYKWEHELFDAFYTDERDAAISRELHPINRFWNMFTAHKHFSFGPQKYENAIALSGQQDFPNPLIDANLVLPEKAADPDAKNLVVTDPDLKKMLDVTNKYRIFVPHTTIR